MDGDTQGIPEVLETSTKRKRPFYKKKRFIALALVVVYLIITAVINLPKSQAESRLEVKATQSFSNLSSKCLDLGKESSVREVGKNRSSERLQAINDFFIPLVQASCLKQDGKIYANKYFGMDLSKISSAQFLTDEYELLQGILYDLDFGFTQFTPAGTICADGWISGSVGRGTCSWHGGYAHPRGTQINFDKMNEITNPKYAERPEKYGVSWALNDPKALSKTSLKASGTTCIQATEGIVDCFPKTSWNRVFCSESPHAYLEIFIEKWWFPVFDTTGYKSESCSATNPYLISVSATSLLPSDFRLRFDAFESNKEFKSYFKVLQF